MTKSGVRQCLFILGLVCTGLGVAGLILPVMPGTVFLLIALWAFSRSSERFERWLYNHRVFGPPLQRWHEHRVISARAKMASLGAMTVSLGYLVFFTETSPLILVATGGLMLFGAWYILTKPSKVPTES